MNLFLYLSTSVAKMASVSGILMLQVLVARVLGAEKFGEFTAYFMLLTFLGICTRFGNDNYVMKYGAVLRTMGSLGDLRKFYINNIVLVCLIVGISSACVHTALFLLNHTSTVSVVLFPFLLAAMNLSFINSYFVRSQGLPVRSCLLEFGVGGGIAAVITLMISLTSDEVSIHSVFVVLLVTTTLISIYGAYYSFKLISLQSHFRESTSLASIEERYINTKRVNYLMTSVSLFSLQWIAPSMLLIFHSTKELGLYNAAFTLTMSIGFIMLVMASIVSPKISTYYEKGDRGELEKLYKTSTLFMITIALPLVLIFLTYPDAVLSVYGPDFSGASDAVRILALSQMINLCFGATNPMLNMTDHSNMLRTIMISCALCSVVLGLLSIPKFGVVGAAFTVMITNIIMNVLAILAIYRRLNIALFRVKKVNA